MKARKDTQSHIIPSQNSVVSILNLVKPRLHACVAVSGGVWFLLETPDHLETIVQVPAAGHWPLPSLARVTPDCGLLGPAHKYLLQLYYVSVLQKVPSEGL